jgi:hypothetical protein
MELAAVRRTTNRFHDISEEYAAGYTTQLEPCVAIPGGPAMGVHARNDALTSDHIVDPLRPELLLYAPTPTSGFRLVGVEYFQIVLVHDGDPTTDDDPTPWFGHQAPPSDRIVGPTPHLFGQRFDGRWKDTHRRCHGTAICTRGSGRPTRTVSLHRSIRQCGVDDRPSECVIPIGAALPIGSAPRWSGRSVTSAPLWMFCSRRYGIVE